MKKAAKVRIHAFVPVTIRDLADKIAEKATAADDATYSRSDVIAEAVMLLAKKEKVQA